MGKKNDSEESLTRLLDLFDPNDYNTRTERSEDDEAVRWEGNGFGPARRKKRETAAFGPITLSSCLLVSL